MGAPRGGTVLHQLQGTGAAVTQHLLVLLWRRETGTGEGIGALGGWQQALKEQMS